MPQRSSNGSRPGTNQRARERAAQVLADLYDDDTVPANQSSQDPTQPEYWEHRIAECDTKLSDLSQEKAIFRSLGGVEGRRTTPMDRYLDECTQNEQWYQLKREHAIFRAESARTTYTSADADHLLEMLYATKVSRNPDGSAVSFGFSLPREAGINAASAWYIFDKYRRPSGDEPVDPWTSAPENQYLLNTTLADDLVQKFKHDDDAVRRVRELSTALRSMASSG
ncbi:hypothetical protein I302_103055 [Kwoniella bestiolae CBS 10118]|uniref:Uncharacterized protein n=1 Tax=Kwoniella bestiolae CBS 10118 TaxID=1296100 RepID=A0A1B9GGN9_9TREE|nr:hypothetical protein I302_01753 [Kwoniella bestiolae CBS 10118]OCF30234.1 hypothetical protein I302_01753 [Kwoniella bestiolae CBS 10118]